MQRATGAKETSTGKAHRSVESKSEDRPGDHLMAARPGSRRFSTRGIHGKPDRADLPKRTIRAKGASLFRR